jgi:hypothetical protein
LGLFKFLKSKVYKFALLILNYFTHCTLYKKGLFSIALSDFDAKNCKLGVSGGAVDNIYNKIGSNCSKTFKMDNNEIFIF